MLDSPLTAITQAPTKKLLALLGAVAGVLSGEVVPGDRPATKSFVPIEMSLVVIVESVERK